MYKYLEQLIELMRAANNDKRDEQPFITEEDHFAEIEAYLHGDHVTVAETFGIPIDFFPPHDKLNDDQINLIVPECIALWNRFRFDLCFPIKVNNRWKYILMRKELQVNHFVCSAENGIVGIEFCSYDSETCGLPHEMCCCRE